jgi:Flp pilus assembly protein TadD
MAHFAFRKAGLAMVLAVTASALSACQSKTAAISADPMTTATAGNSQASFKRTEELSKQWGKDKSNANLGMSYAENLGALGQGDAQIEVLKTLADNNPDNGPILSKVGRQLLKGGRPVEATSVLERASTLPNADWQTFNALGSAYDQQSRHELAREKYAAAKNLNPGEVSIQNNMAMSYSLEGKLQQAEKMLRELLKTPGGKQTQRVRQNLALVVGLQGRFEEARKIASEDLPPDQVEANLAYLQQMLSQPNTWQQLSDPQEAQQQG